MSTQPQYYGTGKRKTSIARVFLRNGSGEIVLTGNKLTQKQMYRHSGYPGGLRAVPYSKIMAERPEMAVEKAVKGMLPSNRLGRAMLKKLKVYAGPEHPHDPQNPKPLDLKDVAAPHNPDQAHTVEEVL